MTKTSFSKLAFLAALAAGVMQAQTTVASVPFGFQVGMTALPAGQYSFAAANGVLLEVRPLGATKPAAYALAVGASRPADGPRRAAVEFRRLGNRYYLSTVWTQTEKGFGLLPTAAEKSRTRYYRADSVIVTAGSFEMSVSR